ncbi:hypothetical protein OMCYN_01648 [cyanobiont of Ornithocercus magnificus]|nr:hypothetical protein OMCYN_01648 [cyanobiont of Ornithocercus magnificus]
MTDSFRPLTASNYNAGFERYQEDVNFGIAQMLASAAEDDRVQRELGPLAGLAAFSGSLSELLTSVAEREDKRQYARGLTDSFRRGVSPKEQEAYDAGVSELRRHTGDINKLADSIESADGHALVSEQVRANNHPWYAYGQLVSDVQRRVRLFPAFLAEAKRDVTVTREDRNLSYDQLTELGDYAVWEDQVLSLFFEGFPDLPPQLLNNHVFGPVRGVLANEASSWAQQHRAKVRLERQELAKDRLYNALQASAAGDVFLDLVGSSELSRPEIFDFLLELQNSGRMSETQLAELADFKFSHRGQNGKVVAIADAYKRDFTRLYHNLDAIQLAAANRDNRQQAQMADDFRATFFELHGQRRRQGGRVSDAEAELWRQEGEKLGLRPSQLGFLKDITTIEEHNAEEFDDYLWQLRQYNGYVTSDDIANAPSSVYKKWYTRVKADDPINRGIKEYRKDAESRILGIVQAQYLENSGANIPNYQIEEYYTVLARAKRVWQNHFADEMRSGKWVDKPVEAYEAALSKVRESVAAGRYSNRRDSDPNITAIQNLQKANAALLEDPDIVNTAIIPGTEPALAEIEKMRRSGRFQMPQIYFRLAEGSAYTAADIANMQLRAAGKEPLIKSNDEQIVDRQDPLIQGLLKFRNTPRRTYRAAVANRDQKWFLDIIAREESQAYGGYDAFNRGGADNGYTAYGSGNSAAGDLDKPITSMTIGEVIERQKSELWAVGRYQFIPTTLLETLPYTGLSADDLFDERAQDIFALTRARLRVGMPGGDTAKGLVNEWRGLKFATAEEKDEMLRIINAEPMLNPINLLPQLLESER